MENVIYSRTFYNAMKEIQGRVILTKEVNCFIIWLEIYTESISHEMEVLTVLNTGQNNAIEVAVHYGNMAFQAVKELVRYNN